LVVAHGNSLRALIKYLDNIPDNAIQLLNIPTGIPIVYEMGSSLQAVKRGYLGDPEVIESATNAAERAALVKGSGE
jgi:2,3-bisphosphoglycerate-dependent phosphoglycerate mutase